jgi:hypothetical protein
MNPSPTNQPTADQAQGLAAKVLCSFCGKSQDDVRTIIAGPQVYIRDECIEVCTDILEEQKEAAFTCERERRASPIVICALCRLPKDATELRTIEGGAALCVECIDAVRSASDDQ